MTFEEYLQGGGEREEKLVAIYKTNPDRLSTEYRALFQLLESENHYIHAGLLDGHDLNYHLQNWDRIKKDLVKQGADFV